MKILFLSLLEISNIEKSNIYTDLMREFRVNSHELFIVSPSQKRMRLGTKYYEDNGVSYLRVEVGNITQTNPIEKGISTLLLETQILRAIKKYSREKNFDLVLFATPPITFKRIVKYIKERDGSRSYLLLKDIFPQNAVDLGYFSEKSILYQYFRYKEKSLYRLADNIGCMSPANVDYILRHNPEVSEDIVEVCPNSIEPVPLDLSEEQIRNIRYQYNIPIDRTVFIYGGNFGKPQGVDFLIRCINSSLHCERSFFVVVGSGTEFFKIKDYFDENNPQNAVLLNRLRKDDYNALVNSCDVGLIFLDRRFTIPNFPSRLLSYMQASIPVLAATDVNTDIGKIIEEGEFGFWCEHGDLQVFNSCVSKLMDPKLRKEMGANARRYLEAHYTARHSYEIIMKHFEK